MKEVKLSETEFQAIWDAAQELRKVTRQTELIVAEAKVSMLSAQTKMQDAIDKVAKEHKDLELDGQYDMDRESLTLLRK